MAKRGRPKKKKKVEEEDYGSIERMAGLGLTDVEIGVVLGASEKTINRWKEDPRFMSALKRGKIIPDHEVVKSLFQRAVGYETQETTYKRIDLNQGKKKKDGKAKPKKLGIITQTVIKHVAGDSTAQIFWLKNRRPDLWRDRKELGVDGSLGIYHDQAKQMTREQCFALMTQALDRGEIELNDNGEYILAETVEPTEKGGQIERKESKGIKKAGEANGGGEQAPGSNGHGKLRVQKQKNGKNGKNGKG